MPTPNGPYLHEPTAFAVTPVQDDRCEAVSIMEVFPVLRTQFVFIVFAIYQTTETLLLLLPLFHRNISPLL